MKQEQRAEETGLSVEKYYEVLRKRKWLLLSVLVVVLGADAVWTFTRTKIYRASATVVVDKKAPQVLGSQVNEVVDLSQGSGWRNKEYMETQRKVITSLTLARQVVEKLRLASYEAFWPASVATQARSVEAAAFLLSSMVSANPLRDSDVIEISVDHPQPALAARLANTVAQAYMDQNIEFKLTSTNGAVRWLSDQLDELKKQLESAELALYEFKKKHNIISLSLEDRQSILARQIERITDSLTETRMRRIGLDAQRKQILAAYAKSEKDPLKVAIGPIMDSPVIQKLKETVVDENRRYVALKEKYLAKHPLVLEQKAKLDAVRKDLEREVNNVLAALESKHKEIRDNENQIAAALQEAKNEALELNKREVAYQRLKRTQENTAKLYTLVLTRMKESDLSGQLRVNNIRLLDAAVEPKKPVRPKVHLNLVIGALLGLLLGMALVVLVDTLDSSIKTHEDIEQIPELTFLGLMPRIPGAAVTRRGRRPDPTPDLDLIAHRNPKSSVAESCRAIRTNVLFAATDRPLRTIAISSPGPREGKTTTAVTLAIVTAQAGQRVVIVDTDMRRPRLHRVFGVPGSEGITSVLLGNGRLEEQIKSTEVPDLYVLPCGPIPPNPAELCQGERFKALLKDLSARFDRVILDSPPVMVVTDAVVLSTIVDGMLLVARTGVTTRTGLRETVRQINDVHGRVLGCVLNDMDLQERGYGYYRYRRYGYYRYRYSRYGYGHYGEKEEEAAG